LKGAGEDFDGLMVRGAKMLEDGKSARAVKLFEAAAQKKPRSPEPFAYLGWCYIDLGKHAEALSQFKQALERSPRYSDAMYGVAEAHEKSGRVEDARKAYEAYLAAHPAGRRSEMARRRLERLP
jgi:tetratricopeptide (TPR) repeat protein